MINLVDLSKLFIHELNQDEYKMVLNEISKQIDPTKFYMAKIDGVDIDFSHLEFVLGNHPWIPEFDLIRVDLLKKAKPITEDMDLVYEPTYGNTELGMTLAGLVFKGHLMKMAIEVLLDSPSFAFVSSTLLVPMMYRYSKGILINHSPYSGQFSRIKLTDNDKYVIRGYQEAILGDKVEVLFDELEAIKI